MIQKLTTIGHRTAYNNEHSSIGAEAKHRLASVAIAASIIVFLFFVPLT